jgi:hypothetical protein
MARSSGGGMKETALNDKSSAESLGDIMYHVIVTLAQYITFLAAAYILCSISSPICNHKLELKGLLGRINK